MGDNYGMPKVNISIIISIYQLSNTLNRDRKGRHFSDDMLKYIFGNQNVKILKKVFITTSPIDYNSALAQILAWRPTGDMPLSEPTMV